ncbi:ATP-binding cassette domain-containing protein [Propionicimonas sp.]|uniref:ATP-binding cassette domain-containing protein n=1 Tax=Propionicimonas sp. TaxID=1955623 RepID=UPI00182E4508|nr:ATP-binding cassette domain-containing protein [Propionicimonas sp.]MBU3976321.1 ATP-binding cassette domain-containing protein [Actinomycetota bacterium]MBA3022086.1 ATP-binding cassette domain-containing protein [Propionicimonas sp.]MBU3987478.1 ATP-binding cassette domain-containing protein [Actinomycetota bacterium]MBU4006577.1 ATP-binding cassette domain-containing protein [Actinomycetota bacterium]MBU4065182.1 ATP-binding cassette domain-containing protein [Actinomycetota bacterium]
MEASAAPATSTESGLTGAAAPLLALRDIDKTFGITHALSRASLTIAPGEVVGLVGPNGAGKSTLIKTITGVLEPTAGTIVVNGRDVQQISHREVAELGISCAYQDLSLCTNLAIYENFALLNMDHKLWAPVGWRKRQRTEVSALLERFFPGNSIDASQPVSTLTLAERQMVEICKALMKEDLGLLILDEPTSALSANRADQLHDAVREISQAGVAVIYISHKLDEIQKVCDRIVLLKNGSNAGEYNPRDISAADLVGIMGGDARVRERHDSFSAEVGPALVVAKSLSSEGLSDVNVTAHAGEIVGVAGLVGSGQTTLLKAIFAAGKRRRPGLQVNGKVAYLSGDRAGEGVFGLWSILDNMLVSSLRSVTRFGLLDQSASRQLAQHWFDRLRFRAESVDSPITSLSGGNQQKALIARGLASGADILLLNDPTAGVDIETKQDIYALLAGAKEAGKAVVLHSTEDSEMEICDRVYVMREGCVTAELAGAEVTVQNVVRASFSDVDRVTGREKSSTPLLGRVLRSRLLLPIAAMVIIYALNAIVNPNVLSLGSTRLLLNTAVPLVFAALGQMFIVTAGDIDMGNGYSIGLANVLVAVVLSQNLVVGIVSLLLLVAGYAAMGALIHLRQLPAIVVTLGAQFIWLGIALIIAPVPGGMSPKWLGRFYTSSFLFVPMPALLCIVAAAVTWFIIFRWKYGMVLRGIGNNRNAIERSGWSYVGGKMANYALAGVMVAFAGLTFTAVTYAADVNTSATFCMLSIATVIVGGCEMAGGVVEPVGVVAAGVAMSLITSLLIFIQVDSNLQVAVTGMIIILVLAARMLTNKKAVVAA